jgi:purine-binding chemotaxis protein CheW
MTSEQTVPERPDQVLEFTLDNEHYCVGIDVVDEIVRRQSVTPLPDTPPQVVGMMDLRGETTTILDPKQVLEIGNDRATEYVIIFDRQGDSQIGWLVDEVHEVADLSKPEINPVDDSKYLNGIVSENDQFTMWVEPSTLNRAVAGE